MSLIQNQNTFPKTLLTDSKMRDKFLIRYWFELNTKPYSNRYFGVTAYDYDDAILLIKSNVFPLESLPSVEHWSKDIDVSTLDAGHVLPNMNPPVYRGIWYPKGFS